MFVKGYMTYVLPIIILAVYLKGYYDMFSSRGTKTLIFWFIFAFVLLGVLMSFTRRKTKKSE